MPVERLPIVDPGRGRLARRVGVVVGILVVVLACVPGVDHSAAAVSVLGPPPVDEAVRVVHGELTLVYDKRRRYGVAKAAELFPNTVSRLAPADFVETESGLHEVRHDVRFPWWR